MILILIYAQQNDLLFSKLFEKNAENSILSKLQHSA
nr:MAG TPA: hypothetical protein [Caudoviricetes sp.]